MPGTAHINEPKCFPCLTLLLLFSHLADAFIQSDLQIRKSNYNYKLKRYKYYIYTFKKIEKLNKITNCLQQHFKTKHLNENKK